MWDFGHGLDSSGARQGQVARFGESSKESQTVHKVGLFVEYQRTSQLLK
jgi:hypothetical protein